MKRDLELEASLVEKYTVIEPVLNERGRRLWASAESRAIGMEAILLFHLRRLRDPLIF